MKDLRVSDEAYATVQLLAKALGTDDDGVIRRLIDEFRPADAASSHAESAAIAIQVTYHGNRVEAQYDPRTRRVIITSGPLSGQSFKSPSGAAIAVVQHYRPDINPNRNGWTFWTLADGGQLLQTVRNQG